MIRIRTERREYCQCTYEFRNWEMVYWFMDQMSDWAVKKTFPKTSEVLTREESKK